MLNVDGLLNLRDLGGTPTRDGAVVLPGRLWRSENQTLLEPSALAALQEAGLSDVIDLRSNFEAQNSPSPFVRRPGVTYHHHSYFAGDSDAAVLAKALPWEGKQQQIRTGDENADTYLDYVHERPDSVLAAVRAIAHAPGAALVHCAVGKDRTGFTVALALGAVGVADDLIVEDYARTTAVIWEVAQRLWQDPTYAHRTNAVTAEHLAARPESMRAVLGYLDAEHGGVAPLLRGLGWTDADQDALAAHLLGS
ncbi:tyrosine-protein phosphatase [Propioniciclava coleopterorum]|uniref:Tyrosine-protein phosphatase n=1 Tax=Propioniciclava coleopterorum TaxID=2714937 RepID=A0A6G7Y7F0_9ACTN|nr:tyrosine-protein phosphatase [Propioniciclava coleopterorum]QIK72639.1 tyrosine-protein phosphatase [Propioniciclava coleopterorum]